MSIEKPRVTYNARTKCWQVSQMPLPPWRNTEQQREWWKVARAQVFRTNNLHENHRKNGRCHCCGSH